MYAGPGVISTSAFDGYIEITDDEYKLALEAMQQGWSVSIEGGFTLVPPPEEPVPTRE